MKEKNKNFLKKHWLDIIAIIYLLLPIDLIPDAIPLFGFTDDVFLIIIDLIKTYYLDSKRRNATFPTEEKG